MPKKIDPKFVNLMRAIVSIENEAEAWRFFSDLCTPSELEAMADRWQVVPMLRAAIPYRVIHEKTGVSVATVTRVARCIHLGEGGYSLIDDRLKESF